MGSWSGRSICQRGVVSGSLGQSLYDWAEMTAEKKEENRVWCEDFIAKSNEPESESDDEESTDWNDMANSEEYIQKALDKKAKVYHGAAV